MSQPARRTFMGDFRASFLKGLAVLLPSVLTLWVFVAAFRFVDSNVAQPINAGLRQIVIGAVPRLVKEERLPQWFRATDEQIARLAAESEQAGRGQDVEALRAKARALNLKERWDSHWYTRSIGLVVAIVVIYLSGRLVGGLIGRRVYGRAERLITRLPLVKQIYPSIKQVIDFLLGQEKAIKFNRVVLVEYPRKGIWTLGLVTGRLRHAEHPSGGPILTVFIPTSPTPFTGFVINVPPQEVIDITMTIDEALRFVISGGVLSPDPARKPGAPVPDPGAPARIAPRFHSGPDSAKMDPGTPGSGPPVAGD